MPPERLPRVRNQLGTLVMVVVAVNGDDEVAHRQSAKKLRDPRPSEAALRNLLFHPETYRRIYLDALKSPSK